MTLTPTLFLSKASEIHNNKYTYPNLNFKNQQDLITVTCPIHGDFKQRISTHIKDKCGCPKCGLENRKNPHKLTTEQFIQKANKIHKNTYNYSKSIYENAHTPLTITCSIHGEFQQRPSAHLHQKQGCPECGLKNRKHPLQKTTITFVEQAVKIHKNTYDYANTIYTNKNTKITYICPKHGEIAQFPTLHLKHGCPFCNGRGISRHNIVSFTAIANKIHDNKYNYEKANFRTMADTITITCPIHGDFEQRAGNHIHLKNGCSHCISPTSNDEKELLKVVQKYYNKPILENDRTILGGKEIDIYLPDIKLGIEYHGIYWHLETVHGKHYHYDKWKLAHDRGIRLLQIYSSEWEQKRTIVESKIISILGQSNRIMARKTQIVIPTRQDKDKFLAQNHMQGSDSSKIWFGLEYNGELVAIMTFGPSRFNRAYKYELTRYCSTINTTITGGASKLLKQFKNTQQGSIITYADKRYSDGNMYYALGFHLDAETQPSFSYFNLKNSQLVNRMGFQKQFLKSLPHYSDDLTEYEIMQLNGYDRIWDAGQYRFILD